MKRTLAVLAVLLAGPAAAQSAAGSAPAEAAATAEASGQVKAVDARAGTITIHHGPIAALGWPAMTMTFKASPEVLGAARPGQSVRFTLQTVEMRVVALQPQ